MNIQETYEYFCSVQSDINEHLPTLRMLAEKCNHVTEMGFRYGVSTYALLSARPQRVVSYDIKYHNNVEKAVQLSKEEGIDFEFRNCDVLETSIEQTDMLFIDTWHVSKQLEKELKLHSDKVNKYLVFHDTYTFGEKGEDGIEGHGLNYAISSFLQSHPEWQEVYRTEKNNGLLVLEKN